MSDKRIENEYNRWLRKAPGLKTELSKMTADQVEDAFYGSLSFGTGGLRGIMQPGPNRMNEHVVARASQGLADYVNSLAAVPSVAIGYDSRINSKVFAETAASVFAANGIRAWLFPRLMPTPCLSYAVRFLNCAAGVMITASHNSFEYNGYKVYGPDGCQITEKAAFDIQTAIGKLDYFSGVKRDIFEEAVVNERIRYIPESVLDSYIKEIKEQSVLSGDSIDRDITIVYSPLNGTGMEPVSRVLQETGFTNVRTVAEQKDPDGHFPTCPYPNPESETAMKLGLSYCEKLGADLFLATDPDCDRCGIAVKGKNGYQLLSGNETGILLLDYICTQRMQHHKMPESPIFVKTIVTTDLAQKIAGTYGLGTVNVLTGFKYIGEVIGRLEAAHKEDSYVFGFEESCGYLTGTYVRDKDAVDAVYMICEMAAFYKNRGISLLDKLNEIYERYGYQINTLHSFEFPGAAGIKKRQAVMSALRKDMSVLAGRKVDGCLDYLDGIDGLPKSDVLRYQLSEKIAVVIRPSGTEPKLKIYCSILAENRERALSEEKRLAEDLEKAIYSNCNIT